MLQEATSSSYAGFHCFTSPVEAELAVLGNFMAAEGIARLIAVNSYWKQSLGTTVTLSAEAIAKELALRSQPSASGEAKTDGSYLQERGTLFIASRESIGVAASSSCASPQQEQKQQDASRDGGLASERDLVCNPASWWPAGRSGEFVNVGEQVWEAQRAAWQKPQGAAEVPPSAPIPYEQVIAGLASLRRTYELPQPIPLAELIDIYLDIWESQDGY